jgi:hypothetical protein
MKIGGFRTLLFQKVRVLRTAIVLTLNNLSVFVVRSSLFLRFPWTPLVPSFLCSAWECIHEAPPRNENEREREKPQALYYI